MTCSYCGTDLPQDAMFCGECGRSVIARATPPTVRTPVPASVVASPPAASVPAASVPDPVVAPPPAAASALVPDAPVMPAADEPAAPARVDVAPPTPAALATPAAPAASDAPRPRDTAGYDPFPWGKPPAEIPVVPPVYDPPPMLDKAYVPDAEPPFGVDLDDETQIVDRSLRGERFILQFSTGESVSVGGTGLLGRNPVPEPGEYFDTVVTISDPGKSVSKTHLEFGQEGGAFWVSDRFSGNGTMVREPERPSRRCEPGKRYRIVRGTRVQIGEQFFIVS